MIVYHGTTERRAKLIALEGFLPKKPSRRVWFAHGKGYAEGRARTKARRAHDRPVVLTCNIDLTEMRRRYGAKRVMTRSGVIAIDAPVPASVLRSHPDMESPTAPEDLVKWANKLLGLKPHRGVGRNHPGIDRLSRWVVNRRTSRPGAKIPPSELLHMARQWLPDFFDGVEIDPERLLVLRRMKTVEMQVDIDKAEAPPPDPREAKALASLEADSPRSRTRGLEMIENLGDPDLFEWAAMFLGDESPAVRLAALRMMSRCDDGEVSIILPLAASADKRIRGAAIAALARHSDDALHWFERGLKDPEPCVRLETAAVLEHLDPAEHRGIFELALYDPNPQIARLAEKYTAGKGYHRED